MELELYEVTLIWTFVVSVFSLGGLTGALIAGPMSIRFGRYRSLLLSRSKERNQPEKKCKL